jgi:hypothetical protein
VVRSFLTVVRGGRQRHLGGSLALWRAATERRSWRGQDPSGLGAHAQDAPAARGQDLEIELVEAYSKLVTGPAQSFLHRLSGEFAVCVAKGSHVSVVSLVG